MQSFFTWRNSWANTAPTGSSYAVSNNWDWIQSTTPQDWGYTTNRTDLPEELAVTCGGWASANLGHSYTNHVEPAYNNQDEPVTGTQGQGLYFAEEMNYGLKYDPQFMFITGWNEWIAGSFPSPSARRRYLSWPALPLRRLLLRG